MENNLVTIREYANLCDMSIDSVYKRRYRGRIEFTKVGNIYFVNIEKYPPKRRNKNRNV